MNGDDAARMETDSLGQVAVPEDAYYGAFTARAVENFGKRKGEPPHDFIEALAQVKWAAAKANKNLNQIDAETADAVMDAATEVMDGKFDEDFVLPFLQAGAGTPFHMNVNEVLANRASELLDGAKGDYVVDPHDDVNQGQSSNNVIPTAIQLAALTKLERLYEAVNALAETWAGKSDAHATTTKIGRTHLQDAVPITYGQVFQSFVKSCDQGMERIDAAADELHQLGIGGSAVGTGLNAHPDFQAKTVEYLADRRDDWFEPVDNNVYATWSAAPFAAVSAALQVFAVDLAKAADDLRLLSSGPRTGLDELAVPAVEEGSSIMPGKVNPSIVEMMGMACHTVNGNHTAVVDAAGSGELEVNVFTPVIAEHLFNSIDTLTAAVNRFQERCVDGLEVDTEQCRRNVEKSTGVAAVFNPYLGYDVTAAIVKTAEDEGKTVKRVVLEHELMTEDEIDTLLKPQHLTQPRETNQELRDTVRSRDAYTRFKQDHGLD